DRHAGGAGVTAVDREAAPSEPCEIKRGSQSGGTPADDKAIEQVRSFPLPIPWSHLNGCERAAFRHRRRTERNAAVVDRGEAAPAARRESRAACVRAASALTIGRSGATRQSALHLTFDTDSGIRPMIAFYPGSFDPPTNGHIDVIRRASMLFRKLVIGVGVHHEKTPLLDDGERVRLLEGEIAAIGQCSGNEIAVVTFDGLVVDAARQSGASVIVRGLRNGTDF